jgi:hypothetical protein
MIAFSDLKLGDTFRFNADDAPIAVKLSRDIWGMVEENRVFRAARVFNIDRPIDMKKIASVPQCPLHLAQAVAIIEFHAETVRRTSSKSRMYAVM